MEEPYIAYHTRFLYANVKQICIRKRISKNIKRKEKKDAPTRALNDI